MKIGFSLLLGIPAILGAWLGAWNRQNYIQTDRQTDKTTDRQTDRKRDIINSISSLGNPTDKEAGWEPKIKEDPVLTFWVTDRQADITNSILSLTDRHTRQKEK